MIMEFESDIKSYQFSVKQLLAVTIVNRVPYLRNEIPTINTDEKTVLNFILKHKDIINDYKEIAQTRKNRFTKDIQKHWPVKITTVNSMVKNNFIDEFNKILEGKRIPRIILKALEFYYPEKMTFVKKRGNANVNNIKGKVKICAISVNDYLNDEARKIIEEVKNMEMIPLLFEKAITHSKRVNPFPTAGRPKVC